MRRTLGKVFAFWLALVVCVSSIDMRVFATGTSVSESAQGSWDGITTEAVYVGENCKVIFTLTDYWESGYNANIKIENTGDSTIENWCLSFGFENTIENIWNAEIYKQEDDKYFIKNVGWNQDIAVGESVEVGFGASESFLGFPGKYELRGGNIGTKEEGYSIDYYIDNDWESGFSANITIHNLTEQMIEDWQLSFNLDNEITSIWNGEIVSHEGNHYVVKNGGHNQNISVDSNVQFGFVVEKGTSENEIYDVVLESLTIDAESDISTDDKEEDDAENSTEESEEDDTEDSSGESTEEDENNSTDESTDGDNTDVNIQITIDEIPFEYDETLECYNIDQKFDKLTGSLSSAEAVKEFYYEVTDLNNFLVEKDNIAITDNWEITDLKLGIGVHIITIVTISLQNEEIRESIRVCNTCKENLSVNIDTSDNDGDMLNNFLESYYGTNCNVPDTDNDGLSDYEEIVKFGTNPLKFDTDENGIEDGEEDFDADGLTNKQEFVGRTNPISADTDKDGLLDGDEVNIYFTDPLVTDTDNDGLTDGEDVKLSFDPLKADTDTDGILDGKETVSQEIVVSINNENKAEVTGVSVRMECAGDVEKAVSITDVYGIDTYSSDVVGLIGVPIEINSTASFEKATITFQYNKEMLGDTREEDLCILWYDEANKKYVLLEDSMVDTENHTVSYTTEHFSTYMLIDRKLWQATWEHKIDYTVKSKEVVEANYDIAICFDYSVNEEEFEDAKLFAENIIEQMESGDRIKFGVYVPNTWNTYYYAKWITNKNVALQTLNTLETEMYDNFGISLKGNYYSENYQAIGMIVDMTDKSSTNEKVGFLINAGKNEDVTKYLYVSNKEQAQQDLQTLGFPVRAVSVTKEMNEELDALLKEYGGNSYDSDSMWDIERKYGYDVPGEDELDSDGDGLLDVYEINGIRLSNGEIIYTDAYNGDSDGDGLSDYDELGGLRIEKIMYKGGEVFSCMISCMNSNPLKQDSDDDGILDGDDPEPLKHFGLYLGSVDFKVTDTIKVPYNSVIEKGKNVTYADYEKIWNERAANMIYTEGGEIAYILNIQTRAYMLLGFALEANAGLNIVEMISGKKVSINDGSYFLAYYLSCIGKYVEYDATYGAVEDPNGLEKYNKYVDVLLDICEKGTKEGKTLTFTVIDSGNGHFDINYTALGFLGITTGTANYWLAVKGGDIGMTGKCFYDGENYQLELFYCIQDYYDFYYEKYAEGENGVGLVNNNEMAFLKHFNKAENFENCGIYHVNISWKKGQSLSNAIQTPLTYSYLGK